MNHQIINWVASAALACSSATVFAGENQRVTELEQRLSAIHAELDQLKQPAQAEPSDWKNMIGSKLKFGGVMELEGFYSQSDGTSASDLTLATAALVMDANLADGMNAHIGLLWEEDDTEMNNLDEAYVIFGATGDQPYHLTLGKMYLPFGNLSSAFISDPLTLELAEINETAALAGYGNELVQLAIGVFNGEANERSALENLLASVTITPVEQLQIGAYWISDLLETDGLEGFAAALPSYDKQGGAGVFLNAQLGIVTLNAEYVSALSKIETGAGDVQPSAYNVEASLAVGEKMTVGLKVEGSDEFYGDLGADKFADEQYGLVAAYAVNEHVSVAGEYLRAEGLDDDESGDQATVQLAIVF